MATWRRKDRESESPLTWERIKQAPLTSLLGIVTGLVGVNYLLAGPETWEELAVWGYLPGTEIWGGKLWPIWSSALLHVDILHLFFNLYWFWFFGSYLEPHLGRVKYAALCVLGTFVSSCAELALRGDTGVGLSGLIYAFFGYAWIASRDSRVFAFRLSNGTLAWMIAWLFICLLLSWSETYDIANAAHFAGVAFGIALGFARRDHRFGALSAVALFGASVLTLFWCPWSTAWLDHQAYAAYLAKQPSLTAKYLERSLKLDPDGEWAVDMKRTIDQEAVIDSMLERERSRDRRASKRQFAEEMMKLGPIYVYFNPSAEGVLVPDEFKNQSQMNLTFGRDLEPPIVDLAINDSGISGSLAFEGKAFHCTVPWSVVSALVLDEERGVVWQP